MPRRHGGGWFGDRRQLESGARHLRAGWHQHWPVAVAPVWNAAFAVAARAPRVVAWDIERADLPAVFDAVKRGQLAVLFVTTPFERCAAEVAAERDWGAGDTEAAHLLLPRRGKLFAVNTDVGAINRLLAGRRFERTLILGSGPTARAAGVAMTGRCRELMIAGDDDIRATTLARSLRDACDRVSTVSWGKRTDAASGADLIFNTTPCCASSEDGDAILPEGVMSPTTWLYDFVHRANGDMTPLQDAALAPHAQIVDGLAHAAAQAECVLPLLGLKSSYKQVISGELTRAASRPPLRFERPGNRAQLRRHESLRELRPALPLARS